MGMRYQARLEMLRTSELYLSGQPFTATQAAVFFGMQRAPATALLNRMADEGELDIVRTPATNRFSKPMPKLLRIPWRTISNEELGITEPFQFGVPV